MLTIFIASFALAVLVSAFCSLMEAALYAVPMSYVNLLASNGKRTGIILKEFKENISKPIAAILILNTLANTAGAALSGWAAGQIFDSYIVMIYSIIFTLVILYCSEIIPKLTGVIFCKQISVLIAYPLKFIMIVEAPLVYLSEGVGRLIQGKQKKNTSSPSELLSMTEIGQAEGEIDALEGSVIKNIINLDKLLIKDILTPRIVVFRLPETTKLEDLKSDIFDWDFSRVPIYSEDNEEILTGYVTQRDIYRLLLEGKSDMVLKDISRTLNTVPELMKADKLILQLIEDKEHISAVADEHGSLVGIITLEDIFEEIVGKEIVDEYDKVNDLRKLASLRNIKS